MRKIERLCNGAVFLTMLFLFLSVFGGGMRSFAGAQESGISRGEKRVFDEGGLFSGEETKRFETQIQSMKEDMNMDVVIVTTEDAGGKTAGKYAEDFYIDGGFGVGKDHSGVLFLIDMDNRELYILPVGKMNRFLTDKRWNAILDDAYDSVSSGEYGTCAQSFLTGVAKYYKAGIPGGQYNYDKETGKISVYRSIKWYEAALAVLVGLFAAGVSCSGVVRQYSMKKERGWAKNSLMAYRADCQFWYSDQADDLVNKTVTHVIIPRNHGGSGQGGGGGFSSGGRSTTHTSSGRTMGGGGRKF
ncbi:TPM domain-containing protein [Clostridium sp. Marseille-P2415]|uniref:TPM domain-containing protein n=1 Tax=Clostridium sp. Marseille-P2415 TaxID=1805471 RepID=UPI0009885D39|nr:TPM domain-containing protein [Clostridium sp. Marseille-P2415]